jgi:hypothetical protein
MVARLCQLTIMPNPLDYIHKYRQQAQQMLGIALIYLERSSKFIIRESFTGQDFQINLFRKLLMKPGFSTLSR